MTGNELIDSWERNMERIDECINSIEEANIDRGSKVAIQYLANTFKVVFADHQMNVLEYLRDNSAKMEKIVDAILE